MPEWGIGETNEGNDGNTGNQGENAWNLGVNVGRGMRMWGMLGIWVGMWEVWVGMLGIVDGNVERHKNKRK